MSPCLISVDAQLCPLVERSVQIKQEALIVRTRQFVW